MYKFLSPKNENVPQNFSQGDKLSPSDQILAQTLYTVYPKTLADLDLCRQVWDCGQGKQYALEIGLMQKHNQHWTIAEQCT